MEEPIMTSDLTIKQQVQLKWLWTETHRFQSTQYLYCVVKCTDCGTVKRVSLQRVEVYMKDKHAGHKTLIGLSGTLNYVPLRNEENED